MATSVRTLKAEAEDRTKETKRIFNPLTSDFTVLYAGNPYTVRAHDMAEFPVEIADHVQKHLVTEILNKENKFNEIDRQKAIEKTTVTL